MTNNLNSSLDISKITTGISFIIGTLILVLSLFNKQYENLIMIGFYYTIIAFTINSFIFLILLSKLIIGSENNTDLLKALGIILLNLPIAFGYFFIVIETI